MTFAAMMRQECGWFDNEEHSSGALSARLTGDAGNLQSVCKAPHFILLQNCRQFYSHSYLSGYWISPRRNFAVDFYVCDWNRCSIPLLV